MHELNQQKTVQPRVLRNGTRHHVGARARALTTTMLVGLVLSGCYNDPESRLAEIRAIQAGGRFEESIKPLRILLTADADNEEANYRLGVALVQTGRSSLGLWPLQKAQAGEEFGTQAGLLLTATLLSQESYEEAIRAANRVVEREPDNLSARYARANALLGAAQPEAAILDADHVLAIKPGDAHAYAIKMSSYLDLKRFDDAEASQIELVKITEAGTNVDQAARACGILARFYADQGDNDKSQETHEVCLEKYPDHPMVRSWASSFYTITGKADLSIAIWRSAVNSNPEDYELRAALANHLSDAGASDEAEEVLFAAAELFDTARAYQRLSQIYILNGKTTKAREALEVALEHTKSEPDILRYTVGDLFLEEGDLESAKKVADSLKEPSYRHLLTGAIELAKDNPGVALLEFEKGLRLWPNNARARFLAGVAAQRLGKHDRAITEFRESIRISETETDASLQLARLYYTFGQFKTARQFAARHLRNRALTSPEAHLIDARSAVEMGNLDAAYKGLDQLANTIFAGAAVSERASIVRKQDGIDAALKVFEASELDLGEMRNAVAVQSYAALLIDAGKANDAIKVASTLLDKHEDNAEAMEVKGRVLASAGRADEAMALINKAIGLVPEFAGALQVKANLLQNAGDLGGALELFDKAAAADFDNPNYAYQAAKLVNFQGNRGDAMARLRRITEQEPGHIAASNDFAWYLAEEEQDLELALELATRVTERQRDANTIDTLGWVQYKLGSIDEAVASFKSALELQPDSASIRYRLGLALAKAGSSEQARAELEQAINGSAFPELSEAKAELARLQGS